MRGLQHQNDTSRITLLKQGTFIHLLSSQVIWASCTLSQPLCLSMRQSVPNPPKIQHSNHIPIPQPSRPCRAAVHAALLHVNRPPTSFFPRCLRHGLGLGRRRKGWMGAVQSGHRDKVQYSSIVTTWNPRRCRESSMPTFRVGGEYFIWPGDTALPNMMSGFGPNLRHIELRNQALSRWLPIAVRRRSFRKIIISYRGPIEWRAAALV
jgi:hypothetical protein